MRLEGKVAMLSGIGQGMGRAAAVIFAQEGAQVAIVARRPGHLEETAERIRSMGGSALVVAADLSDKAEAERAGQPRSSITTAASTSSTLRRGVTSIRAGTSTTWMRASGTSPSATR